MVIKLEEFKESKLVPRNVEGRHEKLRQQNLQLLQQQVIEGDVLINDLWNFSPDNIRTTTINGNVTLRVTNKKIPQWLEQVTINGFFSCSSNNLTSLMGCPIKISGYFGCTDNQLMSLEGMPKHIDDNFFCYGNTIKFTQEDILKDTTIKGKIYF